MPLPRSARMGRFRSLERSKSERRSRSLGRGRSLQRSDYLLRSNSLEKDKSSEARQSTRRRKNRNRLLRTICYLDPLLLDDFEYAYKQLMYSIGKSLAKSADEMYSAIFSSDAMGLLSPTNSQSRGRERTRSSRKGRSRSLSRHVGNNRSILPLPRDLLSEDIHVDVQASGEYNSDANHLIKYARETLSTSLKQIYPADRDESDFVLSVMINRVSDGSIIGTAMDSKWDMFGQAMLGVSWNLYKSDDYFRWKPDEMRLRGSSFHASYRPRPTSYNGGIVILKKDLEPIDHLDPFFNHGEAIVIGSFVPNCASDIVSQVVRGRQKGSKQKNIASGIRRVFSMPAMRREI